MPGPNKNFSSVATESLSNIRFADNFDGATIAQQAANAFADLPGSGVVVLGRGPYDPDTDITIPRPDTNPGRKLQYGLVGLRSQFVPTSYTGPYVTVDETEGESRAESGEIAGLEFDLSNITFDSSIIRLRDFCNGWDIHHISTFNDAEESGTGVLIDSPANTCSHNDLRNMRIKNVSTGVQLGSTSDPTGTNNNHINPSVNIDGPSTSPTNTGVIVGNGSRNDIEAKIEHADVGWDIHTEDNYIAGHFDRLSDASVSLRVRNGVNIAVDVFAKDETQFFNKLEYSGPVDSLSFRPNSKEWTEVYHLEFVEDFASLPLAASGTGSESVTNSRQLQIDSGSSSGDERVIETDKRLSKQLGRFGVEFEVFPSDTSSVRHRVGLFTNSSNHALFEVDTSSSSNWQAVVTEDGATDTTDTGVSVSSSVTTMRIFGEPNNNQVRMVLDGNEFTLGASNILGELHPHMAVKTNTTTAKTLKVLRMMAAAEFQQ